MSSYGSWKTVEDCIKAIENNAEELGRLRALGDTEDLIHYAGELYQAKRTLMSLIQNQKPS